MISLGGGFVVIAGLVVGALILFGGNNNGAYLKDLRQSNLGGQFASDAEAIAHGQHVCSALKTGGKEQGMPVDLVAVRNLCPQFKQGFHVLQTITVKGTFTLIDTTDLSSNPFLTSNISTSGSSCEGTGGYSDIGPGTDVVVTNGSGQQLAATTLSDGTGASTICIFSFSFAITEGQDSYNVSVSHRGTQHFTFSQLQNSGVDLSLGS